MSPNIDVPPAGGAASLLRGVWARLNHEDRAVTSAVVNMAAQMGIQTIAEGVETLEQQQFLEGVGADSVQGYLYLRPAPAAQFGAWLGANLAGHTRAEDRSAVVVPFAPRRSA